MGKTTDLRRALKSSFFPFVRQLGFEVDQRHGPGFVDFRRRSGERVEFIEIQWEKYGRPRFKLSFGTVSAHGTVSHGSLIPANEVGPGQAPSYVILYPTGKGGSTRNWFCQDKPLWLTILTLRRLKAPEQVCDELLQFFPEVESYFATGETGPHCRVHRNPWSRDSA